MTRGESKESILNFIVKNPKTYVNEIVKKLSMSKTTVSRDVGELLQEKRIIPLSDSYNRAFAEKKKTLIRKRQQLVYYDEIEEERGKMFYSGVKKSTKSEDYKEYLQWRKDLRIRFQKTKLSLKEVIGLYKTFNEHDKKILLPILQKILNYYYQLKLELKKQDHRVKYTEWEKILVAYSIAGRFSIGQFTKLENEPYKQYGKKFISKKYVSKLSKQYPVSKDDPRYPKFKKMLGHCLCGHSVADGLIEKISQ